MKGKILFISIISCFLLTGFSTTVKADETNQSQTSQINSQTGSNTQKDNTQINKSDSTQDSGNKQNQTNQNSNNTPVKNNNGGKTVNGNTYYLKNGSATKGFKKLMVTGTFLTKMASCLKMCVKFLTPSITATLTN
ncbi:hypothetical protein [Lactobacillus helveticus]|uniref:hypothetical protein n=1 Tax=Lactobacillus helveticus TaxID=1587 RepID=UPI000D7C2449|nr:hypothetical protein [Lactobacillus helveticus]NRO51193.1 hypothetical protein [Lactobacillus helveticus]NRO68914.1 hypothetical protein [Lactobacillus helveticus]NRO70787.1 hypothetical protein [Lactobacillus helveticus]PXZ21360.1 hypothetical protein DM474_02715 [Lactobacillus helveticus]